MSDPIKQVDDGGVVLEDTEPPTDNSPLLDSPPEESSDHSDDKADKANVGMSTPDVGE